MKRGYTLVETIVVIAISAIALFALTNLFLMFNTLYGYESAFIATSGSAGSAMNALESSVAQAQEVLASHDFSGTTYTSASTTLVLALPTVNSAGDIVAGEKDYVAFYASSTVLYRLTSASAQSARPSGRIQLSNTLHMVSFTYDNADFSLVTNVTADVETRTLYKNELLQARLREKIYLRNAP